MATSNKSDRLERYLPRVLTEWPSSSASYSWQVIDGTLCFVDISGFTALSENLSRRGKVGAEELTAVLDRVFGAMLRLAHDRGGSLLKFGGDALLILFTGSEHPQQAVSAAIEMRAALREASRIPTSVGSIPLKMSVGIETGEIDLFRVGQSHRELVVTGSTATATTSAESAAGAGEILLGPLLSGMLPTSKVGASRDEGRLLRARKALVEPLGPVTRQTVSSADAAMSIPVALRTHLETGHSEAEHRMATVGFLRFKGVGAAMSAGGHDLVAAQLNELMGVVQSSVDSEDVTFLSTDIDSDGGKVIMVAGAPLSHDDDEGRVLRAAKRIVDADTTLTTQIGINRGHVFAGEIGTPFRATYTVMGDTVNVAARIMAAAPPGEVYAVPGVLERSRTLFATGPLTRLTVKGKTEPIQVYSVGSEMGRRSRSVESDMPFVGRQSELDQLRGTFDLLAAGTGGTLGLIGEPGIGKSRLIAEALSSRPVDMFAVHAEQQDTANAYWAFRDPLRALLDIPRASQSEMAAMLTDTVLRIDPDLADYLPLIGAVAHIRVPDNPTTASIEPRWRPSRTAESVIRLFEKIYSGPLVFVVEDTQWLDDASMGLVTRLASATTSRPWLLLHTARSETAPSLDGPTIVLQPLSGDEARSLVVAVTEAVPLRTHETDALVSKSAGHPLFLNEILRLARDTGSTDGLPDSLDAAIGAQIDTLPPLPRRVLRYASVLGTSFRPVVMNELLKHEELAFDAATRRTLETFLTPHGSDRLRFHHPMMQAVAYESLPFRTRRELHMRAGDAIERLAGEDTDAVAEFLALHFAEAGQREKAWHYSVVAGTRAGTVYANIDAATHFRRALTQASRSDSVSQEEAAAVAELLGDVLEQAGLFEDALSAFTRAIRLHPDDPTARADLMQKRARVHARMGSYRAGLRQTTTGLRLVEGSSDYGSTVRSRLELRAAQILLQAGRPAAALSAARRAEKDSVESGALDALAGAYTALDGALEMLGRAEEAVYSAQARQIYEDLNDPRGVASVDNNVGVRAYDEGRWDDAVAAYQRAQEGFRRIGNDPQAALCGANIGEVLVSQGHLEEAEEILTDASRTLRAANFYLAIWAEIQLTRIWMARGEFEGAGEHLDRLRSEAESIGQRDIALEAAVHLAMCRAMSGEPESAIAILDTAEAEAAEEVSMYRAWILRTRAEASRSAGDIDSTAALVEEGLSEARDQGIPYEEALLLRLRAELGGPSASEDRQAARQILDSLGVVVV